MNLSVDLGKFKLKNPVTVASGTYGYATDYLDLYQPEKLGGIFLKGITVEERFGNVPPRIIETPAGMINSIGLQNVGLEKFLSEKIPALRKMKGAFFANISGKCIEDYVQISEALKDEDSIAGIEVNVSCPNVKEGGIQFGVSSDMIKEITKAVRNVYNKCMIVKLSPNVTDIVSMAKAAEDAGADALCVANTFLAMSINTKTRTFNIGNKMGGLSGPCIRPVVVRMVYQVARAVKIPIIGCGGIFSVSDAVEYFLAGAKAISIGTAVFNDPMIPLKVIKGIEEYMKENGFNSIEEINAALVE